MKSQFRDPSFRFRLGEALRVTGTSQRDFAAKIGINHAAVSRWLAGQTEPVRISHGEIAAAIGVPLDMIAPVVARRVPTATSPGNISIPIRSAIDIGSAIDARPLPSIELPEWLVFDLFGGRPVDDRASAYRLMDDSVSPAIAPGAVLILDGYSTSRGWPAAALQSGRIYAVRSRPTNPCIFRRVSFDGRSIICEPVNPDRKRFPVTVIPAEDSMAPSIVPAMVAGRIERFS